MWPYLLSYKSNCAICWNCLNCINNGDIITVSISVLAYQVSHSSENIILLKTKPAGNQRHKSSLVETSETTRATLFSTKEIHFNQWLSGLIDGDGTFQVSKKGYTSCEITVGLHDERMLRTIQNFLGGSIKLRSGAQAVR